MAMNSFSAMSDEELVRLASLGDQEAFACLFGRFNSTIYGKAFAKSRLCGGDMTDDFGQEAAIGFLNAVRSYEPDKGASFRTYAERCIENMLTSAVKSYYSGKNTFLNAHEQLDSPELCGLTASAADDPEGVVLDSETESSITDRIFSGLTELERSVVELRLRDMSYEETAAALGISVKSVDNAIQRVRQKFRSAGHNSTSGRIG